MAADAKVCRKLSSSSRASSLLSLSRNSTTMLSGDLRSRANPTIVCRRTQETYKDCHEASVDPRKGTAACGKNPALVARIEQLSQAFAGRSNRIGRLGVVVAAVSGHIDCSKHRRVAARPKSAILPREHQQAVLTLPTRRARLGTFLSMVLRGAQTTPFASERALQSTI